MSDPAATAPHGGASARAPWHLWAVGVLALLWNAYGCLDYVMTETANAAWLSGFTEAQVAYFLSMPVWQVALWAIGVWGGLAGAVLLLLRRKWAAALFAISLAAALISNIASFASAEARALMGGAAMVITAFILLIGVFEVWYARAMARRGVLR